MSLTTSSTVAISQCFTQLFLRCFFLEFDNYSGTKRKRITKPSVRGQEEGSDNQENGN